MGGCKYVGLCNLRTNNFEYALIFPDTSLDTSNCWCLQSTLNETPSLNLLVQCDVNKLDFHLSIHLTCLAICDWLAIKFTLWELLVARAPLSYIQIQFTYNYDSCVINNQVPGTSLPTIRHAMLYCGGPHNNALKYMRRLSPNFMEGALCCYQ